MEDRFSGRVRLGDFDLDLQTGELFPAGTVEPDSRVLLREQSFQVLRLLIERRGKIVTRDEIKKALWPDDTTVDFDHSINVAIGALRRALGDSADQPRYIETVARRGYRLVANARMEPSVVAKAPRPIRWWIAATALLAAIGLGTWIRLGLDDRVPFSSGDTIVLAHVANATSDRVYDDALYTALRVGLEQTPFVNVLADYKVRAVLMQTNVPEDAKVTADIARDVCLRSNSRMVVATSIADAGNRLQLELNAVDCQTGLTTAQVRNTAVSRDHVIEVLGTLAAQLRAEIGESAASVAQFNQPLQLATSTSLEAVQLLTEGYRQQLSRGSRAALTYYQRAAALDPQFALANAAISAAYANQGEMASAVEFGKKTFDLRARMTEPARFHAESLYYGIATGEQDKACLVLSKWVRTFPHDLIARNNFTRCLMALGELDQALAEAREAARLLPAAWTYAQWSSSSMVAGRLDEAAATFEAARAQAFDSAELRDQRVRLAFLQGDESTMQEQWTAATAVPGHDHLLLFGKAMIELYRGHLEDALNSAAVARGLAAKTGNAIDYAMLMALSQAEVGDVDRARRVAWRASGDRNLDQRLIVALVLARTGALDDAQQLGDSIGHDYPLNTVVQSYGLPIIRAVAKLQANDPASAVKILQPVAKYDFAYVAAFSGLYSAYVRGLAYTQIGEGRAAVAEFQKLIAHPGLVGRSVTGALAHLHLGRALKLAGDKTAAIRSYETFLAIWKDADPDLPVYRQAKTEYGALRRSSKPQ